MTHILVDPVVDMAEDLIDVLVNVSVKVVNSGVNVLVEIVVSVDDNSVEAPGVSIKVDETLVVSIDSVADVSSTDVEASVDQTFEQSQICFLNILHKPV